MWHEVTVSSGEVKVRRRLAAGRSAALWIRDGWTETLRASAIGSCVAVVAYDAEAYVGGMAHVMLPGRPIVDPSPLNTKYAEDAVAELLRHMAALGAQVGRVDVCLAGGANVLGPGHHSPGAEIVASLNGILDRRRLKPVAMDVGGTERRSCSLDVTRGRVTYTRGDSRRQVLWEAAAGHGPPARRYAAPRLLSQRRRERDAGEPHPVLERG